MDCSNNTSYGDISSNSLKWTNEHYNIINYVCKTTSLNEEQVIRGLQYYKGDYKTFIKDFTANKIIEVVMRQTTYSREEAVKLLQKYNGDFKCVIKEYMGCPQNKVTSTDKSVNQQMLGEIRTFMDNIKTQYDKRVENKKNNEIITEYMKSLNK